jgi:hypothetical protein
VKFGQVISAQIPGYQPPGTVGPMMPIARGPHGAAMYPVIQPIGNQDTYNFLAATAWPQPSEGGPLESGMPWPGATPQTCQPPRPNFYQNYPGSSPEGPLDPSAEPWPSTAKPWPGGPLLHNGNGGYAVSSPRLPANGRAPAQTDSAVVTEAAMAVNGATRGSSLMWLVALGLGYFLVTRGRRA